VVVQSRIEHLFAKAKGSEKGSLPFFTHYGDVTDLNNLVRRENCLLFATRYPRTMHCKHALQSACDRGTRSPLHGARLHGARVIRSLRVA
jgi:hypothetical protein